MELRAQTTTAFVNLPRAPREPSGPERPEFVICWARHLDEVRAAQRLRYRVFVDEMGARPTSMPGTPAEHDADRFDRHCEHLLVRTGNDAAQPGQVIGTYRVMTPWAAQRAGGLYTETEFDLTPLADLRSGMVELGRSCVDPAWRSGSIVLALWSALGAFMRRHRLQTMIGCASIGMRDGGHFAASAWERLRVHHLVEPRRRVRPLLPLPVDQLDHHRPADPPALIKGYLRCGAKLMGPPAWDPDFQTADLPLLLRLEDLPPRHRRHFLGA